MAGSGFLAGTTSPASTNRNGIPASRPLGNRPGRPFVGGRADAEHQPQAGAFFHDPSHAWAQRQIAAFDQFDEQIGLAPVKPRINSGTSSGFTSTPNPSVCR
jgi:hypothetical protein